VINHLSVALHNSRNIQASNLISGLSLPAADKGRSLGCGSVTKDLGSLHARKVQLINFISTLREPTQSYMASAKTNFINGSIEQTERGKREAIIIIDSDDEDESAAGYKQLTPEKNEQVTPEKNEKLAPEKNKQLIPSELTGTLTTSVATSGIDEINETTPDRDQNSRIVPYGRSTALMRQYPWSSYQPSKYLRRNVKKICLYVLHFQ
jgi:DNA repair and recombination RAD54-like protein